MTVVEFEALGMTQQVSMLYRHGVYIGKQKRLDQVMLLYQLDHFYVEVIYSRYRRYISRLRCTSSVSVLDPYLEQIDVEQLVG